LPPHAARGRSRARTGSAGLRIVMRTGVVEQTWADTPTLLGAAFVDMRLQPPG